MSFITGRDRSQACLILAFNVLHAVNTFGYRKIAGAS